MKETEQRALDKHYELELNALDDGDPEKSHIDADWLLLELLEKAGFPKTVAAFKKVKEEIGFWYA